MIVNKWSNLGTLVVATCVLAGCGGDGGSDATTTTHTRTTTAVPSQLTAGGGITITQGQGDQSSNASMQTASIYDRHMAGFESTSNNGYFNSAVKLLINSVGPQKLLAHLEKFAQTTQDVHARQAAETFTGVINTAYDSAVPLSTQVQALMRDLQALQTFNELDAQGVLKFNLTGTSPDPYDFLENLAQAFDLETIPGWTIETSSVRIQDDAQRSAASEDNGLLLFHMVDMRLLTKGKASSSIGLQQAVDLLHQDLYQNIESDESAAKPSAVKIIRSMRTENVENLKHLSIMPLLDGHAKLEFRTGDRVKLPIFDEHSQKKMLLTLQPSTLLMGDDSTYSVLIKSGSGEWNIHRDSHVDSTDHVSVTGTVRLITLAVIDVTPAE